MTYHEWFGTRAAYQRLVPHEHDAGDISGAFSNVLVRGDIYSTNWDGALPADLSAADTAATGGFYIDGSAGCMQVVGTLFLGPRGTGANPSAYLKVVEGGLRYYDPDWVTKDYGLFDFGGTTSLWLDMRTPTKTGDSQNALSISSHNPGTDDPDHTIFYVLDDDTGLWYLGYTADCRLYLWGYDTDSYMQWVAANNWAFYMGGTKVLDLYSTHIDASTALQIAGQAVTFGANDSGGAGYRVVRVPNTA